MQSRRACKALLLLAVLLWCGSVRADLVVNGDFEDPVVSGNHFGWYNAIPGWTASSNQIEIQVSEGFFGGRQVVGQAMSPGTQFVELDAEFNGAMYQDLSTTMGTAYQLEFYYSPRNGVDGNSYPASTNGIEIYWEGALLDTITADGPTAPVNQWAKHTYVLNTTSATGLSRLEFAATGTSDSVGGLIDKVSVAVPEPSPVLCLSLLALVAGLRRRAQVRQ